MALAVETWFLRRVDSRRDTLRETVAWTARSRTSCIRARSRSPVCASNSTLLHQKRFVARWSILCCTSMSLDLEQLCLQVTIQVAWHVPAAIPLHWLAVLYRQHNSNYDKYPDRHWLITTPIFFKGLQGQLVADRLCTIGIVSSVTFGYLRTGITGATASRESIFIETTSTGKPSQDIHHQLTWHTLLAMVNKDYKLTVAISTKGHFPEHLYTRPGTYDA